jgi:hypothetical protein
MKVAPAASLRMNNLAATFSGEDFTGLEAINGCARGNDI